MTTEAAAIRPEPAPSPTTGPPPGIGAEEWDLRIQLAAFYRIVDHMGWSHIIHNHITVRVPGPEHHFLINPYGLLYSEVTASNLIRIDIDGNKITPSPWPVNYAGFVIHSAIHAHVPDALCIVHTHTKTGLAVACSREGLVNNNFYSAQIWDQVSYHDFEGATRRLDERERLVQSMGGKPICILRNHGLLVCGRTVPETFIRYMTLQFACDAQVAAASLGTETIPVSAEATRNSTRDAHYFDDQPVAGREAFAALMRRMDRLDPGYRT